MNTKRLVGYLSVSLVIIAVLSMIGCGGAQTTTPTPAPTPSPTATPKATTSAPPTTAAPVPAPATPTAKGPEFSYKVANYNPDASTYTEVVKYWVSLIEQFTGGRVKMDVISGEGLVKARETFEALSTGMVKVAFMNGAYHTGQMPLYGLVNVPYTARNGYTAAPAAREMSPIYQKGLDKFNIKYMWTIPFCTMQLFSKAPIKTMADVKGKLIRAPGGVDVECVKAWGGSAVSMTLPEVYTGVQRGTVDGAISSEDSYNAYRLYEVAPNVCDYSCYYMLPTSFGGHWNLPDFNKLPKDIQDAINKANDITLFWATDRIMRQNIETRKTVVSKGATWNTLPPDELAKWQKAVVPSVWDWAKAQAVKAGAPAADVDGVLNIMKKYMEL